MISQQFAPAPLILAHHRAGALDSPASWRQGSDAPDDVCYIVDGPTGRLLFISPAYARLWGRSCESLHANPASYLDAIHPDDRPAVTAARAEAIHAKEQHRLHEYRVVRPDGDVRWVQDHSWHAFDEAGQLARVMGTARDITASKQAQLELARSVRALRMLSQCHRALTHPGTETELLEQICRLAVEVGGYRMAWIGYARDDAAKRIEPMAHAGHEDGYLSAVEMNWAEPSAGGRGLANEAVRLRCIRQCPDVAAAEAAMPWQQEALQRGYRSIVVMPLCHADQVFGMLALYADEAKTASPDELALLQELVDHVALGVDSLRMREWRNRLKLAIVKVAVGVSAQGNPDFLTHMLRHLTNALGAQAAWVMQLQPGRPWRGRSVAAVADGEPVDNFDLLLENSPCQQLMDAPHVVLPDDLDRLYPQASWPKGLVGKAYLGHRLEDASGQLTGCISVLFTKPPRQTDMMLWFLQIFASRAGAELSRLQTDLEISRLNASLEERVQQRTAELQLANQELESFCYSVSHDLRSPLSAVDGFASLLEQSMQAVPETIPDRGQHYLQRIRAGVVQMGELIDALLMLARVTRVPLKQERIDLSAMATAWLSVLMEHHPGRQVEVRVTPGLFAWGDARLLRQMMDNLVSNAWKFSAGKTPSVIEFGAETPTHPEALPVFFVRDNGAGFNMAYAQKLFGPFQRLHSASEFEGTGVGLATVQRIVTRHGGRVWGEATLDAGATFRFTLGPKHDD